MSADSMFDSDEQVFYPKELLSISSASAKRRRHFRNGRWCARRALESLGYAPVAINQGPNHEPLWPSGVVGSISHCSGYSCAAVGDSKVFSAIGIDAEPNKPLRPELRPLIAGTRELALIDQLTASDDSVSWDKLLFCIKEAAYKSWFPRNRMWLDFYDIDANIERGNGTFSVSFFPGANATTGDDMRHNLGRWIVCNGFIVVALVVYPTDGNS